MHKDTNKSAPPAFGLYHYIYKNRKADGEEKFRTPAAQVFFPVGESSPPAVEKLKRHCRFYKRHRRF